MAGEIRTWYVPLPMLDDNRLVAQHREVHTVFGSVVSPRGGYINHPVTKLYLGEHLQCLISYHEDTVTEMQRRGWNGHATPVSDEIKARAKVNVPKCEDWLDHVARNVKVEGEYGLDRDLHDLVERWTNEHKLLRNELAYEFVLEHTQRCENACCLSYAGSLLSEFKDRRGKEREGQRFHVPGNSSLRNKPEVWKMS